jgi:hypothetical protein
MQLHLGPKPYAEHFDPTGWTEVEIPPRWASVVLSLAMTFLVGALLLGLICLLVPRSVTLRGYSHWQLAVIFVLTIPGHELIHALLQPGLGKQTIFGFWPRRLVFYAFYSGPRTRARTLVGAIGPFLILSVLPVLAAAALDFQGWQVWAVVLVNGCASSNDLLGFFFVLWKIPAGAEVIGQRRKGYWRHPAAG